MKNLVMLVFSASLFLSISSLATDSADDLAAEKRSIEEFISPDGRIDIEAVRISGYQGTLDLDGVDVLIDPKTSEPKVQVSSSSASPPDPDDIYWDNSLSPSFQEINGPVYALAVYDSNLIMAGGVISARGVFFLLISFWCGLTPVVLREGGGGRQISHHFPLTPRKNPSVGGGGFFHVCGVMC